MTTEPLESFQVNNPPPEVTAHRRQIVRKRTMQGWSIAQIAAELGVSMRSVSRMRRKMEISVPKHPTLTAAERARIEDMLADGCSYREIGRTIGRSENTIWANYRGQSTFEFLGSKHLKIAKSLGLEVVS